MKNDNYFKVAVWAIEPETGKLYPSVQALFPFCTANRDAARQALAEAQAFQSRVSASGHRCCKLSVLRADGVAEVPEIGSVAAE